MGKLVFHVDVNSAFLSWEAARRVANGEQDIRLIPSVIGGDREKRTGVVLAKSIPASLPCNSKELLLMGCSQGGFVSALTAAKHPGLVDKLVLFYPALCIPDDARAGKMMFARFDPKNIPERINCGPMKLGRCYVADVIGMDPIAEIKPYHDPVLIVHGTKDKIVKPDYSRQAQRAYPNAKLHIIEGGAHGFSKKHDAIAIAHLRRFAGGDGK